MRALEAYIVPFGGRSSTGTFESESLITRPGTSQNHWCDKGHVVYCLEGELLTELRDGRVFVLRAGMSYQVADGETPHRSSTAAGARLFIVD